MKNLEVKWPSIGYLMIVSIIIGLLGGGFCPLSCSVHCNVKCKGRRGKQRRKAAGAVSLSLLSRASLSVYTEQLSVCHFSQHSHSKMVKSHKDKVVHKAMKSIDKFYNEVPGNCRDLNLKSKRTFIDNSNLFSVRRYFRRGHLVSVLFCVRLLHNCLRFLIIQVKPTILSKNR